MLKNIIVLIIAFFITVGFGSTAVAAPAAFTVFKTNNLAYSGKNSTKIRYSSLNTKTITNKIESRNSSNSNFAPEINSKSEPSTSKPESNLSKNGLVVSISKIDIINQELSLASVTNMPDLDQKMLYNPILDTLTSQPCIANSSTYIMGHSEPATKSSADKPAVRVFKDLDRLKSGDTIEMQNQAGTKCKYQIIGSQIVTTGSGGEVSQDAFNNLYFPQTKENSILKIQTCVKGSATKRLIVTAMMVK